jgi:hypothetical protein
MIPVPRFPPRGPRGRSFPRFVGTIEALRLPAGPPAALRCLRLAVPREHAAVCSRRRRVCRRRAWGWSLGIPGRDGFRGDDRISQVPGEPPFPFAHAPSTPAGRCAPGMAERTAWPPLRERRRRRRRKTFEAQSHGFRAGGLRITMPVTRHRARLASRCSAQALLGRLSPTGLPRKVSNLHHARRPPFPSFLAQSPFLPPFLFQGVSYLGGTSYAGAHVSAILGRILSVQPDLSVSHVFEVLRSLVGEGSAAL